MTGSVGKDMERGNGWTRDCVEESSLQGVYFKSTKGPLVTYDHRLTRIGHPVRYAIHKLVIHGLILSTMPVGIA
jgi:hypothetical protein